MTNIKRMFTFSGYLAFNVKRTECKLANKEGGWGEGARQPT